MNNNQKLFANPVSLIQSGEFNPDIDWAGYCFFTADKPEEAKVIQEHKMQLTTCPASRLARKLLGDALKAQEHGHLQVLIRVNEKHDALYILGNKGVKISSMSDHGKAVITSMLSKVNQLKPVGVKS